MSRVKVSYATLPWATNTPSWIMFRTFGTIASRITATAARISAV